jgi:hypothetical protein
VQGTLVYPGNTGGSNWGGVSVDPDRQLIIGPTNRIAAIIHLIPREQLPEARRTAGEAEVSPQHGTPFGMKRDYLITPGHVPCTPPPWGALSAVDLRTGAIRWEVPLGYFPWLANQADHQRWGSVNLGGVMTTAAGLAFVAGTFDQHLYAFDVENGRELWRGELPAGGNAMPMTYVSPRSEKQYVVIAAGGHDRLHTTLGDYVVAFALTGGPPHAAASETLVSGTWHGDLIPGHERFPLDAQLTEDAQHVVKGELRSPDGTISATFAGKRSGDRITYRSEFVSPPKSCSGTLTGTLDVANDGTLLIGETVIEHNCGGDSSQAGHAVVSPLTLSPTEPGSRGCCGISPRNRVRSR